MENIFFKASVKNMFHKQTNKGQEPSLCRKISKREYKKDCVNTQKQVFVTVIHPTCIEGVAEAECGMDKGGFVIT